MITRNWRVIGGTACCLMVIAFWVFQYPLRYEYYLWRVKIAHGGHERLDYGDLIDEISPHIVPQLISTFEDPNVTDIEGAVAGAALIYSGKERALGFFRKCLTSPDGRILARAIHFLGEAGGIQVSPTIVAFKNSQDKVIRKVVVRYLHAINTYNSDRESGVESAEKAALERQGLLVLEEMSASDPDVEIRNYAQESLLKIDLRQRSLSRPPVQ